MKKRSTPSSAQAHHKILSMAVFPGAGQFAQKRFKVALLIILLFSVSTIAMFYFLIVPTLLDALKLIHSDDYFTPLTFKYQQAIPWGIVSILIYAVNVWDIRRS